MSGWFNTREGRQLVKTVSRTEDGHGRIEEREIGVLPACLMKELAQDMLDKCRAGARVPELLRVLFDII